MLNTPQADEHDRIVERREIPLFNMDSYREAVINAFVHNKWVSGNAPVITIFSDRLEILSYGPLPAGQTIANCFDGVSIPVNEKLTEIFLQLHISEKSGRGVPGIISHYGKEAFTFDENIIRVTIPFHIVSQERNVSPPESLTSKPKLSPSQQRVLALLRENPNLTRQQLADSLRLSRSMTLENHHGTESNWLYRTRGKCKIRSLAYIMKGDPIGDPIDNLSVTSSHGILMTICRVTLIQYFPAT